MCCLYRGKSVNTCGPCAIWMLPLSLLGTWNHNCGIDKANPYPKWVCLKSVCPTLIFKPMSIFITNSWFLDVPFLDHYLSHFHRLIILAVAFLSFQCSTGLDHRACRFSCQCFRWCVFRVWLSSLLGENTNLFYWASFLGKCSNLEITLLTFSWICAVGFISIEVVVFW